MDVVATVRTRILMIDAVRALVSNRVYTGQAPQSPTYPHVVVNGPPEGMVDGHLRGGGRRQTRITVTSVAQSRDLAAAVDAAIQGDNAGSGLNFWRGTMGSPSAAIDGCFPDQAVPFYDPAELRQYRINRDYWVHSE